MTPGAAGELLWLPPSIGGHMGWGAGHASLWTWLTALDTGGFLWRCADGQGGSEVSFPPPNHWKLSYAILTFLKPGLTAYGGGGSLTRSGSMGKCQLMGQFTSWAPMGQPRIWSPGHRNGPIRFLEPFCHLEENSVPSYLFKECSRPYLIAINRSSRDVTGCVISCECSP